MGVSCATFVTVNLKERKRPILMSWSGVFNTYSGDVSGTVGATDKSVNGPDDCCIVPEGVGDNLYMNGPVVPLVLAYGLRKSTLYRAAE